MKFHQTFVQKEKELTPERVEELSDFLNQVLDPIIDAGKAAFTDDDKVVKAVLAEFGLDERFFTHDEAGKLRMPGKKNNSGLATLNSPEWFYLILQFWRFDNAEDNGYMAFKMSRAVLKSLPLPTSTAIIAAVIESWGFDAVELAKQSAGIWN